MIEIQRILNRFDHLMEEKNFPEAERILTYWVDECEARGDKRNRFTLLNELVGFYRMTNERPQGMKVVERLLKAVDEMELSDKVSGATTYINAATAYKSFGMADRALPLYEMAQVIYKRDLEPNDGRIAALYNNMALSCMEFKEECYYEKAESYFYEALKILSDNPGSENEEAITYLNMADLAVLRYGPIETDSIIESYTEKAYELLRKSHTDGNPEFRMSVEKCIPVFRHYGYFAYANLLSEMLSEVEQK